ncbi:MAG: hypothetical protein K6G85_07800 [Eubacterium sp.]|nr:hypothetical protein [Eubacterium sp.]
MLFSIENTLLLYFIYSFFGWCVEVIYVALVGRRVENRGFLNGPVCPIYGFGMLGVLMALFPIQNNIPLLFFGGMFICSLIEFIGGFALDKIFHMRWWDYSNRKCNVGGYICLRYSIMWGIGVVLAVRLGHPLVYTPIQKMNLYFKWGLIAVFVTIFTIDMIVTLKKLIGIRKNLGQLEVVAENLHAMGDQLKEVVGNSAIVLADKGNELTENVKERQKELLEHRDELMENLLKRQSTKIHPLPRLNKNGKSIRIEEYVRIIQEKLEQTIEKQLMERKGR